MPVQVTSGWPVRSLLILCAAAEACLAAVRHVPMEYATIQSALNAVEDGDTVLVAPGLYAEALTAPPLHFTLAGEVDSDTGDYPRPTVDPSSLPDPHLLTCLILPPGSHPVIEDFRFRNSPPMHPRPPSLPGGIRSQSPDPVLRGCVFDSVYFGLLWNDDGSPPCHVTMERCLFRDDSGSCVQLGRGRLLATECLFTGSGFNLVSCGDSSRLIRCAFRNGAQNQLLVHMLIGAGRGIELHDCIFGPYGPFPFSMVDLELNGGLIEGNLFAHCGCAAALGIQGFTTDTIAYDPCVVRENHFLNNYPATGQSFGGLAVAWDTLGFETSVVIAENNVFEDCSSYVRPKAVSVSGGGEFRSNRFTRLEPPEYPAIRIYDAGAVALTDNLIWECAFAMDNTDQNQPLDAEWNWWGDATGPFHATQNPNGHGDTIVGNVDFIPWHQDTSFLAVPGIGTPLPKEFVLDAYPNPFNNIVHLTLIPSQIGIVKVELFDLLGRRVNEIWQGPLAFQKDIAFDASALASGIYFARVSDIFGRRSLITSKLVLLK